MHWGNPGTGTEVTFFSLTPPTSYLMLLILLFPKCIFSFYIKAYSNAEITRREKG